MGGQASRPSLLALPVPLQERAPHCPPGSRLLLKCLQPVRKRRIAKFDVYSLHGPPGRRPLQVYQGWRAPVPGLHGQAVQGNPHLPGPSFLHLRGGAKKPSVGCAEQGEPCLVGLGCESPAPSALLGPASPQVCLPGDEPADCMRTGPYLCHPLCPSWVTSHDSTVQVGPCPPSSHTGPGAWWAPQCLLDE